MLLVTYYSDVEKTPTYKLLKSITQSLRETSSLSQTPGGKIIMIQHDAPINTMNWMHCEFVSRGFIDPSIIMPNPLVIHLAWICKMTSECNKYAFSTLSEVVTQPTFNL
jgi:hypothetical protein